MSITKELYDEYVKKSFFTEKNFSGKYSPKNLSDNMIPCDKLSEFHYQTSFFLNFYASLYIELKKYEETISYNITNFTKTIENLGIIINNTDYSFASSSNISSFNSSSNNFTFFYKTFNAYSNVPEKIYNNPIGNLTGCYIDTYSNILSNSKPNFGSYPNTLIPSNYINFLILKEGSSSYLSTADILKKNNKIIKDVNTSKFKEIIEEVLSQTPENILGYLLYKKIYYNIILYNISIQNSIRNQYLNIVISNITDRQDIFNDLSTEYNSNLVPIRSQINENKINISKLNYIHFLGKNNDFLLEKNEYRNKIDTLNTLRDEFMKTQDKLNISTKLYNQQFINYKSIKNYATYVIISLIIIIISIISISIFPIFSIETKNALYIILLVLLIVITFLYYTNFKYVNLYEKFFTDYHYITGASVSSATPSAPNGSNTGYTVGDTYNVAVSGAAVPNNKAETGTIEIKAKSTSFVPGIYKIPISFGGRGYKLNDPITFSGGSSTVNGSVVGIGTDGAITYINIVDIGSGFNSRPTMTIIRRATASEYSGIKKEDATFEPNFGKIDEINVIKNSILYSVAPTATIADHGNGYETLIGVISATANDLVRSGLLGATSSARSASITLTTRTTTDLDKFSINSEGVYYTLGQISNLTNDKVIITSATCSPSGYTIGKTFTDNIFINNHKNFYNKLLPFINEYSNAYNDLLNNMRLNNYTIGSKTFSQDANIYLYNLYLEKKRQIEINKIKLTNLFNMIEVIKKQINYLFNIIFVIACFSIILLIALVIYSTAPELYLFVIILCVILISILMIYFTFAIVQPTRMIANKNYWAIINPSKTTFSKL